jgi:hypothetical protein
MICETTLDRKLTKAGAFQEPASIPGTRWTTEVASLSQAVPAMIWLDRCRQMDVVDKRSAVCVAVGGLGR